MHENNGDRDDAGRFQHGNKFARGNPLNRKAQRIRAAILRCVTREDIEAVVRVLIREAKAGSLPHARELLDRVIGRPTQTVYNVNEDASQLSTAELEAHAKRLGVPTPSLSERFNKPKDERKDEHDGRDS